MQTAQGNIDGFPMSFVCQICTRGFANQHSFYQHMHAKHKITDSPTYSPSPAPAMFAPPPTPPMYAQPTPGAQFVSPPPPPAAQVIPKQPQTIAHVVGTCARYDPVSRQGQAACCVLNGSSNVAASMIVVHFGRTNVVIAPGDPPEPYVGQLLLLENVILSPTTSLYWAGRVKDGRSPTVAAPQLPLGYANSPNPTPFSSSGAGNVIAPPVQQHASIQQSISLARQSFCIGFIQKVILGQRYGFISKTRTFIEGRRAEVRFQFSDCQFEGIPVEGQLVRFKEEAGRQWIDAREVNLAVESKQAAKKQRQRNRAQAQPPAVAARAQLFNQRRNGEHPSRPQVADTNGRTQALADALRRTIRAAAADSPASVPQFVAPPLGRPVDPEEYRSLVSLLEGTRGSEYVGLGVSILGRTRPQEAESLWACDSATRQAMLVFMLKDEMDGAAVRLIQAEIDGNHIPPPIQRRPPPPPIRPQTFHCSICMDDEPIDDVFIVSGCQHSFCRESIRTQILSRMENEDVTPNCPIDGCAATISDTDITMVLTEDEQRRYFDLSLNLAARSVPDVHTCLNEQCRGIAVLGRGDTHFQCPVEACNAERCVSCNTREWHAGLTCEQFQQQVRDNELQPEQLRALFGGTAYMCGRCQFGPILHLYCTNLATHHNEAHGQARINNACPQCGWFTPDIANWPRWNGEMYEPNANA